MWYANIKAGSGKLPEELLSGEEISRAGKYRFEEDRCRFILARCMLRTVLATCSGCEPRNIAFEPGPDGKPRLQDEPPAGLHFNLSHSGDVTVVAVALGKEVGVDVEIVRAPVQWADAVRRYLAPGELALIDGLDGLALAKAFYRTWTRKEALLKATGEGLCGLGPELDLSAGSDFQRMGKSWHVTDLCLMPDYAAALAVEGRADTVRLCPWRP